MKIEKIKITCLILITIAIWVGIGFYSWSVYHQIELDKPIQFLIPNTQ